MERKNKPALLSHTSASLAQPSIDLTDNILTAKLPSGDSCTVNLFGATVTSWKTSSGDEQLFLSTAAALDGSKPIRGGIPLVFPVFGPPPKDHATGKLPQHGFARNNTWEFLGKSSSENTGGSGADDSVKLDFGLSSQMLGDDTRAKWPYDFGLVYSVTLGRGKLETQLHVQNKGGEAFEFQVLFHSYLNTSDISKTTISGLQSAKYVDKVRDAQTFTEESDDLGFTGETDRVYTTPAAADGKIPTVTLKDTGKPRIVVTRDALPDATIWNGWEQKIGGMGDFQPKDGWKRYVCIEPGTVSGWTKLEGGDAWEGSCIMEAKL